MKSQTNYELLLIYAVLDIYHQGTICNPPPKTVRIFHKLLHLGQKKKSLWSVKHFLVGRQNTFFFCGHFKKVCIAVVTWLKKEKMVFHLGVMAITDLLLLQKGFWVRLQQTIWLFNLARKKKMDLTKIWPVFLQWAFLHSTAWYEIKLAQTEQGVLVSL